MALSGSVSTNAYDGRYYKVSWTATQSIDKNASDISWKLESCGQAGSWYAERTLTVVVAGKTVVNKTDRVQRYDGTITSGKVTVTHAENGSKSFSISIKAAVYVTSVNCTGSQTFTLDTIPRKSTLSAENGTLGTEQTLTVTRKSSNFTHTITYKCGSASGTICDKSSSTSIPWTPPVSLASQNTTATKVDMTLSITTYNGSTNIGSNSVNISCTIPSSVVPSLSVAISESTNYADTYGGYIQNKSKLQIELTPSLAYGSPIVSYSTLVGGISYSGASVTTDVLKESGDSITVASSIKDKRGRGASVEKTIVVKPYSDPVVDKLTVNRCDSDGTANDQGEYIKAKFSATVTSIGSKNTASYKLLYKKTSDENYTERALSDYEKKYSVVDGSYIFAADSGASYDVKLQVTDAFTTVELSTSASTAFSLMHFGNDVNGIAFGKTAEIDDYMDVNFKLYARHGLRFSMVPAGKDFNLVTMTGLYLCGNTTDYNYGSCPISCDKSFTLEVIAGEEGETIMQRVTKPGLSTEEWTRFYYASAWQEWFCSKGSSLIPNETDLDGLRTPGIYYGNNQTDANYGNVPNFTSGTFALEVQSAGPGGQVRQVLSSCEKTQAKTWERYYYSDAFGKWVQTSGFNQKTLWSGGWHMNQNQTANLSEKISAQVNGIVLVFNYYNNDTSQQTNQSWHTFFVPKNAIEIGSGYVYDFWMGQTNFGKVCGKALYLYDDHLTGVTQNTASGTANGITYKNSYYVLRYVFGV